MIRPRRRGLALVLGVAQVLGASLPARAQGPVTWQLGRVQFADSSANAQRALRIDEMSADSTGGFVRITALNDGECVPGAGLYWRPELLPAGNHEGSPRIVRLTTGDAWPNPVFFAIAIWGFRGKRPIYLTATYPYTPATAPPVPADRPTQDMIARAARDRRFGAAVAGSLGSQLNWAPTWELHWLDFSVTGGRRVRIYHAT